MTVTRSVDQEKQLTIFTVVGDFPFEAVMEVLQPFYEKHPTKNVLWDLRNTSMKHLPTDHIEAITDYVKQHGHVRAGGKTAWVVSKDLEYGLFRMVEVLQGIRNIPFQAQVFRSMDKAVQWLEEGK